MVRVKSILVRSKGWVGAGCLSVPNIQAILDDSTMPSRCLAPCLIILRTYTKSGIGSCMKESSASGSPILGIIRTSLLRFATAQLLSYMFLRSVMSILLYDAARLLSLCSSWKSCARLPRTFYSPTASLKKLQSIFIHYKDGRLHFDSTALTMSPAAITR